MRTKGQFLQDTPFSDGQIFIGAANLYGVGANFTINAVGNAYWTVPAATTENFYLNLGELLRTGTAPNYQEQFGTAALVPGPSGVANTSDPLALYPGLPPIAKANLDTITGGKTGYVSKGLQINWVDVIYQVNTLALTSQSFGLAATKYTNNAAPVITNIIAQGANGLQTAVQAQPYVTRINVAVPSFIVTNDTSICALHQVITPATSTLFLFGYVFGVSYNFN